MCCGHRDGTYYATRRAAKVARRTVRRQAKREFWMSLLGPLLGVNQQSIAASGVPSNSFDAKYKAYNDNSNPMVVSQNERTVFIRRAPSITTAPPSYKEATT